MTAPRLAAAKLVWLNRRARAKSIPTLAVLLCACALMAVFAVEGTLAPALLGLQRHGIMCAALAAFASAVLVARRRSLKRAELARSWLVAVPVRRATARWESLAIETLPAIAAVLVLLTVSISYALMLSFTHSAKIHAFFIVCAYLSSGIAVGAFGSYLIPQPKPVDLLPGSRYVPHLKGSRKAGIRPSLRALGIWPIRRAFALAQPKALARATIPILLIIPMGTTADAAMLVIAMCGIAGGIFLLFSALISTGRLARRWLAPLPVPAGALPPVFLLPSCAVLVGAAGIEALLLLLQRRP